MAFIPIWKEEKMSIFGFSTEQSEGGDFTPIVKYDARAGRVFRVDREQGVDGYTNNPVDITTNFRAVFDFENVEAGWIDFPVGSAPSFALAPMGQPLPDRPSPRHKNGIRMLVKLNKACGGDKPVREIASTAKAFLSGVERAYAEYAQLKAQNPGMLPVLSLESTTPVTSGSGQQKSTNYTPQFRIEGWAKRPDDLIHIRTAKPNGSANTQGAPSTGGQTVPPPNRMVSPPTDDNDFG